MLGTTSCCRYLWWSPRFRLTSYGGKEFSTDYGRHTFSFQAPQRRSEGFAGLISQQVESRITSHGLTAADVQTFVDEIKKHPQVSMALLEEIRGEVGKLMKGQRFSFDFD